VEFGGELGELNEGSLCFDYANCWCSCFRILLLQLIRDHRISRNFTKIGFIALIFGIFTNCAFINFCVSVWMSSSVGSFGSYGLSSRETSGLE
jgi:hypothetical protein